jgi:hypothetical protein
MVAFRVTLWLQEDQTACTSWRDNLLQGEGNLLLICVQT